jgi:hypothetical protein
VSLCSLLCHAQHSCYLSTASEDMSSSLYSILSTTIARKLTPFHWCHSLLVTLRALRGIDRTDSNPKPPSVSCADSTLGLDLRASSPSSPTARPQNLIGSNPKAPRDEVILSQHPWSRKTDLNVLRRDRGGYGCFCSRATVLYDGGDHQLGSHYNKGGI